MMNCSSLLQAFACGFFRHPHATTERQTEASFFQDIPPVSPQKYASPTHVLQHNPDRLRFELWQETQSATVPHAGVVYDDDTPEAARIRALGKADTLETAKRLMRDPANVDLLNARNVGYPLPLVSLCAYWPLAARLAHGGGDVACHERENIISLYAAHGADLNTADTRPLCYGNTPLMWAIANANTEAALFLARHPGVDIKAPDVEGKTPLHFAILKGYHHRNVDVYPETALPLTTLIDALIERGAGNDEVINARDVHGNTPLHYAALHHDDVLIGLLLKAGADPAASNREGQCPADMLGLDYANARQLLLNRAYPVTLLEAPAWENPARLASLRTMLRTSGQALSSDSAVQK